jgi:integrase
MSKPRRKKRPPKRVLALPDLEQSKAAVLNTLTCQRSYDRAITDFVDWYCSEPRLAFNRTVVLRYRIFLEQKQYVATTINLRLAAARRVAFEAADSGLLSPELAAGIRRVKGVRRIGVRVGNWLTAEQAKRLLAVADRGSPRGKRDYAMIAMLVGCGLRRGELLALRVDSIQSREEHWVIADLLGKAGHIRTVPIPSWVKVAIDEWKEAGCITEGALFRSINKTGRVWGTGMTPKVLWEVVRAAAKRAGIEKLAPHDLRRYAESRTMPNQNAATSLRVCEIGAAGHRLLRTMRHSPVVTRRREKLNSGPQVGTFCLRHHAHCFKNWLPAGLRQ